MQNRNVTIHHIAARLNLSASTVSRALSDYSRISRATRELVKKTAVEMNYKPNQLATSLRKGRGNMIGVVIPRLDRHFFSHTIAGMETITNPSDYNIVICQTNEDYESEKQSINALAKNRVDGIIISLAAGTTRFEHIQSVINEGMPVVMFDRVAPSLNADMVINDNFAGAYEATCHLIGQGYRMIYHFAGPQHINVYGERLAGYKKAMNDNGLDVTDAMIFHNVLTRDKGEKITNSMVESGNIPDAIFAASDFSALGALVTFKKNGILVPRDVGIAGFANEPFTELIDPGLTTLEQFGNEIGKSACRLLIDKIENKGNETINQTITFKPKLIIRSSSERNK